MKKLENRLLPIVRNLDNVFLIDWLSITFHGCKVDEIQSMLGLTKYDWTTTSSFVNGYPMVSSFSNIHIRWGADDPRFYRDSVDKNGVFRSAESKARSDMGIQLDLSGQGCRAFEEFSEFSWFDLFERIYRFGGRFSVTRIDLAYDDHTGLLDIWRMRYDVENRNYISKSKKAMLIWSDDQEHDIQGLTIQIGSKSSPVLIRIYDKAAERGFGDERHWIRVELQLRADRAHEALRLLFQRESVGKVASGILRNYCSFVVPSADSNRSRWELADYWVRVLEGMEKLRVWIAPGEPYNFKKSENHLIYQYGQFIQAYYAVHGGISTLLDRARDAHPELKPKYINAVNAELAAAQKRREEAKVRQDELDYMMLELGFSTKKEFHDYEQANFAELFLDDSELPDNW